MLHQEWYDEYIKEMPRLMAEWKERSLRESLYAEGENDRADVFISDGVAFPELWFDQEVRPLFILKEAYDTTEDHADWDEVEWFISGGHKQGAIRSKTWRQIAIWGGYVLTHHDWHWSEQGILHSDVHKLSPVDLFLRDNTWANQSLRHIAVMNIKKYGGHSRSVDADLKRHALAYAEYIYRQIELIKPTVIICGHTGWLMDIAWTQQFGQPIRTERNDTWVYDVPHLSVHAKMLDYWHPSDGRHTANDAFRALDNLFADNPTEYAEDNENKDDD